VEAPTDSPFDGLADTHRASLFSIPGNQISAIEMPCLVISRAARHTQEVIRTTIRGLAALPRVAAPSILIVGATGAEARADLHIESGQREEARTREEIVFLLGN
jgi:siroheme synthase